MKFIRIKYTGRKPMTDRTTLRTRWEPGDTNLVPESDARALLRFHEFTEAPKARSKSAAEEETTQAQMLQVEAKQREQDEIDAKENMLRTVDAMTAEALADYALKYDVKLDRRRREDDLRTEVAGLVERFGVR